MLGKYPSYNYEVSNAAIDIIEARPNDATTVLADELQMVVNGNYRTFTFSSNLMGLLREASEIHPAQMQPIATQAIDIYSTQGREHYWYDLASDLLQNIYAANPNYLPAGLEATLRDFLQDEKRDSVQRSTRQLLDTII